MDDIQNQVSIVTIGNRVFIGVFSGFAGCESILEKPLVLVEMVQVDRSTNQPVGFSFDMRKPCMALDVPEVIFLIPETVQVLNDSSKDKLLAGYYKEALDRYAAESVGIIAPSGDDLRKVNVGKL